MQYNTLQLMLQTYIFLLLLLITLVTFDSTKTIPQNSSCEFTGFEDLRTIIVFAETVSSEDSETFLFMLNWPLRSAQLPIILLDKWMAHWFLSYFWLLLVLQVAKDSTLVFNPDVEIEAYHDSIMRLTFGCFASSLPVNKEVLQKATVTI